MGKILIGKDRSRRERRGASLFTVLLLGAALTVVALGAFIVTNQTSTRTSNSRNVMAAFQIADGASEYVRLKILEHRRSTGGEAAEIWVQQIANYDYFNDVAPTYSQFRSFLALSERPGKNQLSSGCNTQGTQGKLPSPAKLELTRLDKQNKAPVDDTCLIDLTEWASYKASAQGFQVRSVLARILPIFKPGSVGVVENLEIRVTATLEPSDPNTTDLNANGGEQTVVRGVLVRSGSADNGPRFAIATRNINCAFCHLRVNGDVAAIEHLRPVKEKDACVDVGKGKMTEPGACTQEGDGVSGINSEVPDSVINGDVSAFRTITDDASNVTAGSSEQTINKVEINDITGVGAATIASQKDATITFKGDGTDANPGLVLDFDLNKNDALDDLPPLNRKVLETKFEASGTALTIGGNSSMDPKDIDIETGNEGGIYVIPPGQTYDTKSKVNSLAPRTNGSVILIGTKNDPIKCNSAAATGVERQKLYVTGDVIIKGYVDGQCTIYSGRNTYIAGEIIYKDNVDGIIANRVAGTAYGSYEGQERVDLLDKNSASYQNVAEDEQKDSLVLGAVGNVILGDYTNTRGDNYSTGSGDVVNIVDRQSEDFLRSQFDLKSICGKSGKATACESRSFDISTNEEVTYLGDGEGYLSASGSKDVDPKNVRTFEGKKVADAYDPIFKPGFFDGEIFKKSITDDQYRGLLGQQVLTDDTVRVDTLATQLPYGEKKISISSLAKSDDPAREQKVKDYLREILVKSSYFDESGESIALNNAVNAAFKQIKDDKKKLDWNETSNSSYNGELKILKIVLPGSSTTTNQVERLDAFVRSNARFGGKISGATNLMINGGFMTRDFGLLAPGIIEKNYWIGASGTGRNFRYDPNNPTFNQADCSAGDPSKVTGTAKVNAFCTGYDRGIGMSVNYDYRLSLLKGIWDQGEGGSMGTVYFFRVGGPFDRVVRSS